MQLKPGQIEKWVVNHFECKRRSSGKQLNICNPFDGDDGWHFWISTQRVKSRKSGKMGYWVHDFRPGHSQWDGNFISFVMKYRKISYFEALREVCGSVDAAKASIKEEMDEIEVEVPDDPQIKLPDGCKKIEGNTNKIVNLAINYLASRKVDLETCKKYDIHYAISDIIFPYYEFGEMVFWQSRSILGKEFRYPNSSDTGLYKTDFLYAFDFVEPGDVIMVAEAIFGAITVGDGAVATGGGALAAKQLRKMKILKPSRIILIPDNDKAGLVILRNNYRLILPELPNVKLEYCLPPKSSFGYKDWNEYDICFGNGWSRKYIEENSRPLGLKEVINPRIGNV